jgi:hypothetical protein
VTETYDEYRVRMRQNCRPFSFFGITPVWRPGEGDVDGFIHDEVVRQFHDTRLEDDGGKRIRFMTRAWQYAQETAESRLPTVDDVLQLGAMIEPSYNSVRGVPEFRHENVYIGDRLGVYPPFIRDTMRVLMDRASAVVPGPAWRGYVNRFVIEAFTGQAEEIETVDQFYVAFEWIHPFRDGNGRTGKILHNWLSGTLDDPVLVSDYFGGGNP